MKANVRAWGLQVGSDIQKIHSVRPDFPSGITPPSAKVSSAATSRTVSPSVRKRSSVMRLVMPDTEIAANGSLQSL
jgi:hypothetical protein